MSWVVPPLLVPPSLFAGAAVPAFLILGLYISCGAASGLWRGPRGVRRGVLWCSRRGSLLCFQHIIRPGPETAGVQETAKKLGALLGREPVFTGEASDTAYLNNAGKMFRLFGYPTVPLETLIEWQAQWILDGGRALGKPTHFEERKGSY